MVTDRRAVSMSDVAARAGVSAMTVSRVLNNKGGVSADTQDRVLAAAAGLDYHANQSARSLRLGASDRITVVVRTHPNLDFRMVSAFEHVARHDHRRVEVTITGPTRHPPPGGRTGALDAAVSGTVMVDVDLEEAATGMWQAPAGSVVVVTAEKPVAGGVPTVSTQDDEGARLAVAHLVDLGHERIAHVAGPRGSGRSVARQRGWALALSQAGLGRGRLARGDWSSESGELATAGLLVGAEPPTAVFVADDAMAMGVLKHLHRSGIDVPDEVSVMGFGDLPGVDSLIPGLSTVRLDYPRVAAEALELMGDTVRPTGVHEVRGTPQLVLRESTGPVLSPPRG